jgi:hypothetical protein
MGSLVNGTCRRIVMRARAALVAFVAISLSGCGLVFQGTSQTIHLTTQPEGATIEFHSSKAVRPSDDQIPPDEWAAQAACLFPYLYDPSFAAKAERIVVSAGPLQQPHELLGNVDFGKLGFDRTEGGAIAVRGFAFAWARRTFSKATPAEINALLRKRALYQYGERVDALINVGYQSDPANNVFATAVAVHFTEGAPQPSSATTRLNELEKLHKSGLIDQREYEQKRAEILRGL